MVAAMDNAGAGRGALPLRPFDIPTDPNDPDVALWRLVRTFMECQRVIDDTTGWANEAMEAGDKRAERSNDDLRDAALDMAGDIEMEIFSTPAQTPKGFMVKLQLVAYWIIGADRGIDEPALPSLTAGREYFTADCLEGGEVFELRAITSAWQDAVRLFGLPPALSPDWRMVP